MIEQRRKFKGFTQRREFTLCRNDTLSFTLTDMVTDCYSNLRGKKVADFLEVLLQGLTYSI